MTNFEDAAGASLFGAGMLADSGFARHQLVGSAALAAALAALALLTAVRGDLAPSAAPRAEAQIQELSSMDAPAMRLAAAWRRAAETP